MNDHVPQLRLDYTRYSTWLHCSRPVDYSAATRLHTFVVLVDERLVIMTKQQLIGIAAFVTIMAATTHHIWLPLI
jgi:hypothetical protein